MKIGHILGHFTPRFGRIWQKSCGETFNLPVDGDQDFNVAHLDDYQWDRLDKLQKSLANMLKMRMEAESVSGGEEG